MSKNTNKPSNAVQFSIIGVLIAVCTVVVYIILSGINPLSGEVMGYGFFQPPEAASRQAAPIDALFQGHFWLIAFLFAVIVVPLLYSIVMFRQEEGDETDAPHIHGNTALEIAWTVLPLIFVFGFAIWGWTSYFDVISPRDNEVTIRAQAYKWDWTFFYPEHGNVTNQSLVLRIDEPVVLEMQSQDIIHAFWVPKFRVKQDIVPFDTMDPRENFSDLSLYAPEDSNYKPQEIRFTPTVPGVYRVRCAEICGTNHYAMLAHVFVLDDADYQSWLDGSLVLPSDPNLVNAQPGQDGYYLDELELYESGALGAEEEPATEDESAAADSGSGS